MVRSLVLGGNGRVRFVAGYPDRRARNSSAEDEVGLGQVPVAGDLGPGGEPGAFGEVAHLAHQPRACSHGLLAELEPVVRRREAVDEGQDLAASRPRASMPRNRGAPSKPHSSKWTRNSGTRPTAPRWPKSVRDHWIDKDLRRAHGQVDDPGLDPGHGAGRVSDRAAGHRDQNRLGPAPSPPQQHDRTLTGRRERYLQGCRE